jgi:Flp pilus assembly protein TadB
VRHEELPPEPGELHPDTPDVAALKRRVLVTGVLSLVLWVAAIVLLDALGLGPLFALLAAVVLYATFIRPMMRPVRDAVRLRRRLAYQAWLDAREDGEPPGTARG